MSGEGGVEAGEDKGRGTSLINQPALEIYLINVSLKRRARCQLAHPSAYTNTDPRRPPPADSRGKHPSLPALPSFAHFFIRLPIINQLGRSRRITAGASDRREGNSEASCSFVGSLTGEMLVVITGSWPLFEDTVPSCWVAVALLP